MTDDQWDDHPSDIPAEQFILSAMMQSGEAIAAACEHIEARHFYRASHRELFNALVMMMAAGEPIDLVTLRAWIEADQRTKPFGDRWPMYLTDVYSVPSNPMAVTHYARLVLAAGLRRDGIEAAERLKNSLCEPGTDPDDILGRFDTQLEKIRALGKRNQSGAADYGMVTSQARKEHELVIPGLLGEQDRVVVVAGEGRGKTTLAHQMGFCAAAGVHPFQWGTRIEPKRVLIADFENPALELSARFSRLGEACSLYAPGWDDTNMRFYLRMGGINLTRGSDAFEFMDVIRRFEPQLIIAGPIYKMIWGLKPNEDGLRAHAAVASFFDQVRERYGSAVWLESHAPMGSAGKDRELRPEGWNGWMKWPEVGLALHRGTKAHGGDDGVEVKRFRGDRIAGRAWPSWLTRYPMYPSSGFPWQAGWDKGVLDEPLDFDNRYDLDGDR